jgi:integrase
MLAQGTPLHVFSEVLGHASIAITKDVYGRLLEGDKEAPEDNLQVSRRECAHHPSPL